MDQIEKGRGRFAQQMVGNSQLLLSGVGIMGLTVLLILAGCGDSRSSTQAVEPDVTPTEWLRSSPLPTGRVIPSSTTSLAPTPLSTAPEQTPTLVSTAQPTAPPAPLPTVTKGAPPLLAEADQVLLNPPLLVDGDHERLYASAQVGGKGQVAAMAATNGQLLDLYPWAGKLGLDAADQLLYVDQAEDGLQILEAGTGDWMGRVDLGDVVGAHVPPLADPAERRVLAFRENRVHIIDPYLVQETDQIIFDIRRDDDCRTGDDPLPISGAALDAERRILYLGFVTHVCTPWVSSTIVSYDIVRRAEIHRAGVHAFPSAVASGGALYGSSWFRMGIGYRWRWEGGVPVAETSGWSDWGQLVVDSQRGLLYEAHRDVRALDPDTLTPLFSTLAPVEGSLVGYDPISDQLYFLHEGRLQIWSVESLYPPNPVQPLVELPPALPVGRLSGSLDGAIVGLWDVGLGLDWCSVMGVVGGQLYISSDSGVTWRHPVGSLQGSCQRVSAVALSPAFTQDHTILVGVVGLGMFRSTDGGHSWQPASAGLDHLSIEEILLSPTFPVDGEALLLARRWLYHSVDGGTNWQGLDITLDRVALSPEYPWDRTVMGLKGGQIMLSEDGGESWSPAGKLPEGGYVSMLAVAPEFSRWGVAFTYLDDTLYHTRDGGQSWTPVLSAGLPNSLYPPQIVFGRETDGGRQIWLRVTVQEMSQEPPAERDMVFYSEDAVSWRELGLPPGVEPTSLFLVEASPGDRVQLGLRDGRVISVETAALVPDKP